MHTDHKPLLAIVKKPFDKLTPRLQRFVLRLQRYKVSLVYKPGTEMFIADLLSRNYRADKTDNEPVTQVHSVKVSNIVSADWVEEIEEHTLKDEQAKQLYDVIKHGWPEHKNVLPASLQQFWQNRFAFHISGKLILYESKLFIPSSLRPRVLKLLHESHLGVEKMKTRARENFYWPKWSADIEEISSSCSICLSLRPSKQKEPLLPHPVPEYPWEKVGCDIFEFGNHSYLLVVDYFSKYPEIARLPDKTADSVVHACKLIFARFGIPETVMSDNMPFNSHTFKKFCTEWHIKLVTSSPRFPQSNGLAERNVQTIKSLLKKACKAGTDPEIALLEFRTTPLTGFPLSPAQLLMSRNLRTKVPTKVSSLKPTYSSEAKKLLCERQKIQKRIYDRTAKTQEGLKSGDVCRYRAGRVWEPCKIVAPADTPRSYNIVTGEGASLRRTSRHLIRCNEPFREESEISDNDEPPRGQVLNDQQPEIVNEPLRGTPPPEVRNQSLIQRTHVTRGGRVTKPPQLFKDYV